MENDKKEIHNTRQFELLEKQNQTKKNYKKLIISISIVVGLFVAAFLLTYGIFIIKNGGYDVS